LVSYHTVGRLPTADAQFLSPLLDANIIHLGGTVIDCPPVLTTGCDILLCIRVYFTKEAFMSTRGKGKERETGSGAASFWNNQAETVEEMKMRLRKVALGELFGEFVRDG
jgi:DNA repair protein RAD5